MSDMLQRICQTPGIDVSDKIAVEFPRELFVDFGDSCFKSLESALDLDLNAESQEKLHIVIEELPRYSDGVPKEFVDSCIIRSQQTDSPSKAVVACLHACIRWESTWRNESCNSAITSLIQLVLSDATKHAKSMLQLARWRLDRIRKGSEGVMLLESGRIQITNDYLDQLLEQERKSETKFGFNEHGVKATSRVFARYFTIEPLSKLNDQTYRTTCDLYSDQLHDRHTLDIEWSFEKGIYQFAGAYWGVDQTIRRRKHWGNK